MNPSAQTARRTAMADPFSIATGAVGLLGLAASLTKSLHEFSVTVKTSTETLSQIRTNTDILSHMLSDLSPVLSDDSVGAHEKQVIEMCVSNCKGNFERIGKIVRPFLDDVDDDKTNTQEDGTGDEGTKIGAGLQDKSIGSQLKAPSTVDAKSKFRMKLRRLTWPFKEKETRELLDIIGRTIQQLGLALDTVHSYAQLKYQQQAIKDTQAVTRTIETNTVEIQALIRKSSTHIHELKAHAVGTSSAIELRLQKLEDAQRVREQETQKLLLQLLEKFETSGSSDAIATEEVTHAVDPLAREIIQKTINQDFSLKHAYTDSSEGFREPPPAYTPTDTATESDGYSTTAKDWAWETPFGRISIFTTHHQRDEEKTKGVALSKNKSASRYKMMFTPAPWLYSKAAAFAFIKRVDGFGMQFTTPAIFKSDEPALKYLRRGEFGKLRDALGANGFLLNAVHESTGRTLLAEAVRCRRFDACQYLLELGADPETEDHRGSTLFNLLFNLNLKHYQVNTCLKIFSLLLDTRADIFRGKATVMHSAVTTQYINIDPQMTKKILTSVYSSVSNFTSIDDPDIVGNSPLVSACTYGHDNPVVIDFLLSEGAARNALPEKYELKLDGKVPLPISYASPAFYAAVRAGYIATMRRLIEAGVPGDVNMRTDYGRTILHNNVRRSVKYNTPRKSENSKVAQFQKKHKIWKGNVEYLISRGADINAIDPQGFTVLHWAAVGPFCDQDLLQALVECGADGAIRDRNGRTAWDLVVKSGRVKMKPWRWFGVEMFKRGKLGEEDLKGRVAKHLYMTGKWWKTENGEGGDDENEELDEDATDEISQDPSVPVPDDEEWLFMSSMHPFESEQVFGDEAKLADPDSTGVKHRFPRDEFWFSTEVERRKPKTKGGGGGGDSKSKADGQEGQEDDSGGRTWLGTVGNVLAAFVG
ncbi:Serine/threonine-protein phosphatase [Drechslerella dactyloides]|uniref:Serine/threonine-protein phosphatase n=1 Tax=Drechslerella dactyloides TaxID=74499 RepID=A0AAD6IQX5_DREDA|nr:Serine/threonine-protein phosphatase [Drechslerella dactyloides]